MKNILDLLSWFFLIACNRDYIYIDETTEITGNDEGECIAKKRASSGSVGEWYVCEMYEFENNKNVRPSQNFQYANDTSWIKQNWKHLPFDSNVEICNTIFNYCGTNRTKELSEEMKIKNALGCGYYSFCVKPSLKVPRHIIFCMFDTIGTRLYVVDAHL